MVYTPNVSPNTYNPTADITLSDGTTTMSFIVHNNQGDEDNTAIVRNNARQSPFIAVFSNQRYDDENAPYGTMIQQDWSGGRGQEDFEDNTTKYYDASGIDTINGENGIILNGLPKYSTGIHNVQENWYGNVTWRGLYDESLYISEKFQTEIAWNTDTIKLYAWAKIRKVGSPTSSLFFKIYSSYSGYPNNVLVASAAIPYTQITDTLGVVIEFEMNTGTDLAISTNYHVVIYASANGNANNHWEVACDGTSTTSCISANGTSWTVTPGYAPYYRFFSESDMVFKAHFFEYKKCLYLATQPEDGSAGKLYRNGWSGSCDSNSGNLDCLIDNTAPGWKEDEVNDNLVKVIEGTASRWEHSSFREIDDSTTTELTVKTPWKVTHDYATSYVIIGSNRWTEIDASSYISTPITSVAIANGIVYLATDESHQIVKFRAYNDNGTWKNEFGYTGAGAQLLSVVHDDVLGPVLWMGRISYDDEFQSDLLRVVAPLKWDSDSLLSGTTIEDCKDEWNESDPVSGVTSTKYLYCSVKFDITDTFTTGIIASEVITSTDIRSFNKMTFQIKSTIDLNAGVLQILLDNTAMCTSPVALVNLPALKANSWANIDADLTKLSSAGLSSIISIGLNCTEDQNQDFSIYISGPIRLYEEYSPLILNYRINAIESYGSPQTLWVIGEDEVGYISNGYYVPSEIKGLKPLASELNGRAHVADDVYLYFNIGNDMHRYYSQCLYDISIYKGAGVPSNRVATPVAAVAYKDRVYVAYDGGYYNYSYIMCHHSDGDHEAFRAPIAGKRIYNLYIQPIDGSNTDRLWISMDRDILWIPISSNPYTDNDYKYDNEGYIESSYIYGERRDIKKFFKSMKLVCENVSTNNYYVQADYKLDNDTIWTAISNDFDDIEEEVDISSATPPASTGKRLRYRLRFYTNDITKSPRVKQFMMRGVGYSKQKYQYSFYFKMKEGEDNEDLEDNLDTTFSTVKEALEKLNEWAEEITPLTMRCVYSPYDNKTVFVLPGSDKPVYLDTESKSGEGREEYYGYVTLLEA